MEATGRPAKSRTLFYGWWIVALGFINNFMGVGIGTYAFAVSIKPMTEDADLGWSRTQMVWAITISIVIATVTAPWIGRWLDKQHGARIITVLMGLSGAVGVALVGTVHELWQLYLLFGVVAALFLHDPPFLTTPTTVAKWFIRQRGKVLSIGSMGIPVGGLVFVPVTQVLISSFGWRSTWMVLGIAIAIIIIPSHALLMRGRPEDLGLQPDGREAPSPMPAGPSSIQRSPDAEVAWTLRSAMKTMPFWLILVANNLGLAGLIGVLVNQVAYLEDELPNESLAIAAVWVFSLFSLLGKVPWVVLADRTNPKNSTVTMMLLCAIGIIVLIKVNTPLAFLYAILFGLGIGGFDPLISLIWANYYGRTFLGAIRGFTTMTNVVSFAGAPLFASFMFDTTGDYRNAFVIFLAGFFVSAGLLLLVKRPKAPQPVAELAVTH
ncbi:MAG: MFS transporter [Dehalococcoidia bacterium]